MALSHQSERRELGALSDSLTLRRTLSTRRPRLFGDDAQARPHDPSPALGQKIDSSELFVITTRSELRAVIGDAPWLSDGGILRQSW
jgi:hypothetical protein